MPEQKLYEVQIGYRDDDAHKDRWLGTWRGVAASDEDARAMAECDASLDAATRARAVYTTCVKPRYVVAEHWGHIFVGEQESTTRWAYDRFEGRLVNAEIQTAGRWSALTESAMKDLLESIHDNDADGTPTDFDLDETDTLPEWANSALIDDKPAGPAHRRAKP